MTSRVPASSLRGRVVAVAIVIAALGGCAVGPRYTVPQVGPAALSVGSPVIPETAVFDSLAQAARVASPATTFDASRAQSLAWLDVLHDSVLIDLVRTALDSNREIRTAVARIDQYRAEVGVARSALFPEVDGTASYSKNRIVFAGTPVKYDAWLAAGTLQWEIDFWGRIRNGVTAAVADRESATDAQHALVLSIVAQVADGYLSLLELREDLAVSRQTLASRQSTLGLARQRYSQGVISEVDVRQFEADVAAAASSVAEYTRQAAEAEHALSLLVGQAPRAIDTTGVLDQTVAAVAVPDSVPASLLTRRPDVAAAERALAAADARIGVAVASRLPRIVISGEYGSQSARASDLFGSGSEIYTAQAGVSVPIFTGGRLSSDVAAARAEAAQARAQYEETVLTAMREAADALVAVRTGRDELAAQTAETNALADAYRLAERRYEGGIASYLEVLDAQRSLFAAQLAAAGTRRAYFQAIVELYRALGGRWDQDMTTAVH